MMEKNSDLYPRLIEPAVREVMRDTPVTCILGPRQCGKTTLVNAMFSDRKFVSMDEANDFNSANDDPSGFVRSLGDFATIDEVQKVPDLIPAIKLSVDSDRRPGRFLLTGSSNLLLVPGLSESLAGRMEIIELQALSEAEKCRAAGFFLRDMMADRLMSNDESVDMADDVLTIEERVMEGGYVEPLGRTPRRARDWRKQYISRIVEKDVPDTFGIRNAKLLDQLVELLALRTGQLLNVNSLVATLGANRITVERYLAYLERVTTLRL